MSRNVIRPDENIGNVPYKIITQICDTLDQNVKWRNLIEVVDERRFILRNTDVEKLAHSLYGLPAVGTSPSYNLWKKYSDLAMKVHHMHKYLEKLRLEKPLILLQKEPEPLIITKHPKANYECSHKKTLLLKCEAKGFPFPRYTWFKASEGRNGVDEVDQSTTGVLEIKSFRKKDAGFYQCRVHNSLALQKGPNSVKNVLFTDWCLVSFNEVYGETDDSDDESGTQPVSVSSLVIQKQTTRQIHHINMKEKLYLECKAQGTPPLKFQWIKDDAILEHMTSSKLLIEMCFPTDAGTYWCIVRSGNHAEISSLKYTVTVIDPQVHPLDQVLIITRFPQQLVKVNEGGQATFSCEASTREGSLVYNWYHIRTDRTDVKVSCGSETLQLKNVTWKDTGKYYCEVQAVCEKTRKEIQKKRTMECELQLHMEGLPQFSNPIDKVALFIGIENYRAHGNLNAVRYDIQAVQHEFQEMGFKILSLLDLTLQEIHKAVDLLCDFTEQGVYVVLYFVGHGFYQHGNHYLTPWDAPHGLKIEECFCLEEAHAKVQHKEPTLLLMIYDICREDGREKSVDVKKGVVSYKPKISGNSITFFAASRTEKSFEPIVRHAHLHEERRGIFCRHFCEGLSKFRDRPVMEVFHHLLDRFREYDSSTCGKKFPMHPVLESNLLERNRKLTDHIVYKGKEMEAEKRLKKFNFITQLPTEKYAFQIRGPQMCLDLQLYFEKQFSNKFVIVFDIVNYNNTIEEQLFEKLELIVPNSITKVMECGQNQYRFILSDVQRLKGDLQLVVHVIIGKDRSHIKYDGSQVVDLMTILNDSDRNVLKRPLISASPVWLKSPKQSPMLREPTEDDEDT